ncbi:hypothetical protein BOTBODRAFT_446118 [Botryobasidium botryosum FD-172 SS1]|uniref:Uncharacterized protein n=1 Tax=Botryobasidium botryosum (strain FD-172 SS1) TaxID=930990 RepID=A0A067M873_BOTB1|nr:hypothetical protein BOTBODRAFT_446118 [Botryobasidium botryosum FD-172 SS1]
MLLMQSERYSLHYHHQLLVPTALLFKPCSLDWVGPPAPLSPFLTHSFFPAIITLAADSFWIHHGYVDGLGIKQAFQDYVNSDALENVKAAVFKAFSEPIDSYSTHACNTKLCQILMDNYSDVGQPSSFGSA